MFEFGFIGAGDPSSKGQISGYRYRFSFPGSLKQSGISSSLFQNFIQSIIRVFRKMFLEQIHTGYKY